MKLYSVDVGHKKNVSPQCWLITNRKAKSNYKHRIVMFHPNSNLVMPPQTCYGLKHNVAFISNNQQSLMRSFMFQILGLAVFALCVWIRFDGETSDWIDKLQISGFYIGLYILMLSSLIVMIIAILGCVSSLTENVLFLLAVSKIKHENF